MTRQRSIMGEATAIVVGVAVDPPIADFAASLPTSPHAYLRSCGRAKVESRSCGSRVDVAETSKHWP
jgi:hypothetical protein